MEPDELLRVLEEDLDAVADDHPAAVHGDVGADAEVAPVELGGGREAGPGAAVGIAGEAVDVQGQGDPPGHPVQVSSPSTSKPSSLWRMPMERKVIVG